MNKLPEVGEPFNPYKMFVGSFIPQWLECRPEISPGAKLVYARMCRYSGKNGKCNPRQGVLAKTIGLGERQARTYIKELEEYFLIGSERLGLGKSNVYKFLSHEWMFADPERQDTADQERNDASDQEQQDAADPDGKDTADPTLSLKESSKRINRRESATAPFPETVNQPQDQKQEKPNAETLSTEARSDCAAPAEQSAPIDGLRSNSERPEPSVAGTGVGEDFPSWKRYVMAYYETRDEHAVAKHLRAADKGKDLTGEKVAAWCARCGTFQEWLRSNVDGTFAGKTNGRSISNGFGGNGQGRKSAEVKRLEPPAVESKRPLPPVTSADRTREFFFEKVIPLDIQVHGKQTLWYNSTEHPKVFAMAWQCYWPEEEILKRLPRYWRSTNDFYRKAGYNLRLFFQNFDEFADQLTKTEMRYPMLSDVYAAQEQAAARNEA